MSNTNHNRNDEPLIAVQLSDSITLHVTVSTLARVGLRGQPSRGQPRTARKRSRPLPMFRRREV